MTDIVERLQDYLSSGGLMNPELMDHDKVRDVIIDARDDIERLEADNERLRAALREIVDWKSSCKAGGIMEWEPVLDWVETKARRALEWKDE